MQKKTKQKNEQKSKNKANNNDKKEKQTVFVELISPVGHPVFQAYVSIDFTEWASVATVEVPVISLASAHSRYFIIIIIVIIINTVKRVQHTSDTMKRTVKEVQTSPPSNLSAGFATSHLYWLYSRIIFTLFWHE